MARVFVLWVINITPTCYFTLNFNKWVFYYYTYRCIDIYCQIEYTVVSTSMLLTYKNMKYMLVEYFNELINFISIVHSTQYQIKESKGEYTCQNILYFRHILI